MPFLKLTFRPGINRDTTNYANTGGWFECDKIRFFSNYPQKIGGWVRATSETFIGTCRQLANWITSFTDNFLALAQTKRSTSRSVVSFTTLRQYERLLPHQIQMTALKRLILLRRSPLISQHTAVWLGTT
jgi:hypothetical protein